MQALLIDIDGVLYVGDKAIPGAAEAIGWLDAQRVPYLFVTNTTSRPRADIVGKLARLGFNTTVERVLSPPVAATSWLERQGCRRVALFVPARTTAEFSCFEVVGDDDADVDAVVVGDLGEAWDFATLNRAFRYLMCKPQPALVALGMTRYWRAPDGLRLDTAPFVMALAHAAAAEPVVLGKPAAAFFAAALETLATSAATTLMIGDDIRGDVLGAQDCGLPAILVRTGKFREDDLAGDIEPLAVLESIAVLPQWWEQQTSTD